MCKVKIEDLGVTKIRDLFKVGTKGKSHILVIPWFLALPNIKQLGKLVQNKTMVYVQNIIVGM
jgi:hypothetical protein